MITDAQLLDPGYMLEATGTLLDQTTDTMIPYSVDRVAPYLQRKILDYVGNPPRDEDGFNKWLVILSSRQVGKSVCAALALYYYVAYRPNTYAAIITDTKERSEDLFRAINACHKAMEGTGYQMPSIPNRESRQLTFGHLGKIRTLSAEQSNVGIGRAMSFGHLSELPFMPDAAGLWSGLYPAIVNRKNAPLIMESTPAEMSEPSAQWYQDMCISARVGEGRMDFLFAPFYSSFLNERTWRKDWKLEKEEIELLNRFGPKNGEPISAPGQWRYLTLENLAFRRHALINDAKIKRHPDLFKVFFPTDTISCWQQAGGAAIPSHALSRHLDGILIPWAPHNGYQEYADPKPGAIYALGADPAGWMGGDQASFQVFEIWGDEWIQVAEFSSNTVLPVDFARKIIEVAERFNDAQVIVENNGVGLATLSYLELAMAPEGTVMRNDLGVEKRYHLKNLYYHVLAGGAGQKPGIPASASTNKKGLAYLIDALMDTLTLRSELLVAQLQTYGQDKELQASEKWGIVNPGKVQKGRRSRHHWDRVSALIWTCYLARSLPQRYRPSTPEQLEAEDIVYSNKAKEGLTYNQERALIRDRAKKERGRGRQRAKNKRTKYKKRSR